MVIVLYLYVIFNESSHTFNVPLNLLGYLLITGDDLLAEAVQHSSDRDTRLLVVHDDFQ